MAAASSVNPIPAPIFQAVEALIAKCADAPFHVLFKRRVTNPNTRTETVLRRDIAFAVLTSACFDSQRDVPVFGGFATPELRKAVTTLKIYYTQKSSEELNDALYDRRGVLYSLFYEALCQRFGDEKPRAIPIKYDLKKLEKMRLDLFRMGYALQMGSTLRSRVLHPRPFQAVLDPLKELEEGREPTLPNRWVFPNELEAPLLFKQKLFREIHQIAFVPGYQGSRIRTHTIVAGGVRFPRSLPELFDIICCCRRLPVRVTLDNGDEVDGVAYPLND